MPKDFMRCAKSGGRVRTMKKGPGRSQKICFPKGGGKAKVGHMHKNKGRTNARR